MRFTIINALLVASTATAASIPRQLVEQPQIVLADVSRSQLDHLQLQPTPSPIPAPEEEEIKESQTSMLTTTVTETTTIAMTTATVIRTETVSATSTATPTPSNTSSSSLWSWSLKAWLWGSGNCKGQGKEQEDSDITKLKGLEVGGLIDPKRLAEGMGCFCSAGSVCCYNSDAQIMCNYGSCGVI